MPRLRLWVTHEGDGGVRRHIQRRGSGPQGERQPQCRLVHRGRPAYTQRMVQLPGVCSELYDRPSAAFELKTRMLRVEVLETVLYGCVMWSPRECHYDTLRRAQNIFFTRCIGWRKNNRADHPISYLNTLIKTASESIEATKCSRRILFTRSEARMEDTRLPKCAMFGELMGSAGCEGPGKKGGFGVFWTTSELSVSASTSERLQPRARGNGARRRNKGRNVSWRN